MTNPDRRRLRRAGLSMLAALMLAPMACARADEVQALKAQVQALLARVGELERRPGAAQAVSAGATKGSFKLPGPETSVTLGGYAKLDLLVNSRSAGAGSAADQLLSPTAIPVGPGAGAGDGERNQVTLHARQTRLFLRTATPTALGALNTHIEFELFGASGNESVSNSHGLRLRHAYGSLGRLLAGQTWSTFMDVGALPETIDFGGPVGQIFVRQAQIRWTQPFEVGSWSVTLENPESVPALPGGGSFRADDDRLPDLAANVHFRAGASRYSIAALARRVRVDTAAATDARWGGGLAFNAVVPLGDDRITLTLNHGRGLGRYFAGVFLDGVQGADGRLDLATESGGIVSYRHPWNPQWRSNIVLSASRADYPSGVAGTLDRSYRSAHLNLIYAPLPQTSFGAE